ncbi:tetraspanin-2 isoform X5 [Macaca fascicularis]|uniref:tetraspanin-2 isoform X5 n=1 Tax=Macaca fascicularis TaxID=9541 RepID=UPI003D15EB2E
MGRFRGGLRCIKYLLLGFNLLFWLAGSAVIAFGLWFRFGGAIKELSSEDKSPEYFYVDLWHDIQYGPLLCDTKLTRCDMKLLLHENCNLKLSYQMSQELSPSSFFNTEMTLISKIICCQLYICMSTYV